MCQLGTCVQSWPVYMGANVRPCGTPVIEMLYIVALRWSVTMNEYSFLTHLFEHLNTIEHSLERLIG